MLSRRYRWFSIAVLVLVLSGCASIKTSDTARTGLEQLLISSAADQALGRVDFTPIRGAKVFVEPKFLDCVDKNYILLALNQKLLANGCTLTEKADEAEVIVQVASGGVGTDKQELMFGVPSISLPPPAMISTPELPIYKRTKLMGTAKLRVVAIDAATQRPVVNAESSLARSDHRSWTVVGAGPFVSGRVPTEVYQATGDSDSLVHVPDPMTARRSGGLFR